MRSFSAFAILAAAAPLVSAAPRKRQQFTHTLGPAPFQANVPTVDRSVTAVDLDLSDYSAYGWPEDRILLRISRTPEKCSHPYAQPFTAYCIGQCLKADPGSVYPPAKAFSKQCNFSLDRPTREANPTKGEEKMANDQPQPDVKDEKEADDQPQPEAKDEEKKANDQPQPEAKDEKKDGTSTGSSTQAPASIPSTSATSGATQPEDAAPKDAPTSTASPISTSSPTNAGSRGAATPTRASVVEVTNGASKSFDFAVAVTVAALAMLAVY
ncbi:Uncharacterized protein TPAR_01928 [Tolypocladium paradoxum]|uniref:Uncharacterized protein n=1 Tax=Tolypocladium paradoxum TaxID=94208 RepID=A0A2S4L601_9HYPO|nr:Uncharacterized protein TPAR_01928 [Tolypocladium paradoxum]